MSIMTNILLVLVFGVGTILLQIFLSRRQSRWPGLILPALRPLMKESGQLVCLVKPQFEAGKDKVGKKGVVRDPAVHLEVVERFYSQAEQFDFSVQGMTFSPIRGPEGNIEYLGWLSVGAGHSVSIDFQALVAQSHETLEAKQ